jgi:hypothetical protein
MFKWIEDLIGSNDGQGRKKDCCGCGCERTTDEVLATGGYSCTMPGDLTATPLPPTNPPLEEEPEEPFTVKLYLATGGDPITIENAIDWDFFEDINTGKVTVDVYPKDKEVQVFIFMRGQLSYATAI